MSDERLALRSVGGMCGCGFPVGHTGECHFTQLAEIDRLRAEIESTRKSILNQAGDNLCWFDSVCAQIPPREEFLKSCGRFHSQMLTKNGELHGCMTIAQLEAINERLRAELQSEKYKYRVFRDACEKGAESMGRDLSAAVDSEIALEAKLKAAEQRESDLRKLYSHLAKRVMDQWGIDVTEASGSWKSWESRVLAGEHDVALSAPTDDLKEEKTI